MKRLLVLVLSCLIVAGSSLVTAQAPVDEQKVNDAIDLGVRYLRSSHQNGLWKYQGDDFEKNIGVTALAGLALLEAKVKPDDSLLKNVTEHVLAAVPKINETYTVSLAILFLDRQGRDQTPHPYKTQIRSLATLLKNGQFKDAWSYGGKYNAPAPDNSNTQFAILALWIARKHDVRDVDKYLLRTANRFRKTQQKDGGWGYGLVGPGGDPSTQTMTCAGLLGLFLEFGAKKERQSLLQAQGKPEDDKLPPAAPAAPPPLKDIRDDLQVKDAFNYLGQIVGRSVQGEPHRMYLLWSIERVALTYKVKTINNVNWYDWGAAYLLTKQKRDGSWIEENGPAVDTAFALLFLRRANIVGEIETRLRQVAPDAPPRGRTPEPATSGRQVATDAEVAKLVQELTKADAQKQLQLIDAFQNEKGPAYTRALAEAIPSLRESVRDKARLALVERLKQLNLEGLRSSLHEQNAELRRAAALAASRRTGDREALVPDLIEALKDKDAGVQDAAHEALRSITGKSLDNGHQAWADWWKARGKR